MDLHQTYKVFKNLIGLRIYSKLPTTLKVTLSNEQAERYGLRRTKSVSLGFLIECITNEQPLSFIPHKRGQRSSAYKSNLQAGFGLLNGFIICTPAIFDEQIKEVETIYSRLRIGVSQIPGCFFDSLAIAFVAAKTAS